MADQRQSDIASLDTAAAVNTSATLPSLSHLVPTRSSQRYGLDIHSCLQLLIDVYGSTLLPSQTGPSVHITLFNETIRSVRY